MTTVADVVVDGLVRAGTARVFAAVDDWASSVFVDACERRGLLVVRVDGADVACVMGGVAGMFDGVVGAALVGGDLEGAAGGVAYAAFERVPVVVMHSGAGGAEGAAKAVVAVTAGSAAHWIAHACQLAMKEPWGPVRLDVAPAVATAAALPVATSCRPAPLPPADAGALAAAARLLGRAERPVVVVGRLCRSAEDAAWIRAFVEARPAAALATPNARGVLPDPHPLLIGTLDGGDAERALLAGADLVVAIGLDPAEPSATAWPPAAPVLDLTPLADESRAPGSVRVVGEIGAIVEELAPRLRDSRAAEWDVARLHALKHAAAAPPTDPRRLTAHRVVETVRRQTPAGTVAVFDGGDVWPPAARAWQAVAPGECLVCTSPRTRGYAVAAATAAQAARRQQRVVCFAEAVGVGDQLATLAALGVPALVVVDDAGSALAVPPGLRTLAAASAAGFPAALEAALGGPGPALLRIGLTSTLD